jgi:hypothetical protein
MLDLLMGVLSGGVTGLLGTVISGGMKFFENKQKHSHELAIMDMEMKQMDKEASIAKDIAELNMEGADRTAAWAALEASYKESTTRMSTGDSAWLIVVDVVRGLMRPAITLGTLSLMAVIYFTIAQDMAPGPDGIPVQVTIVQTVLYIATTSVLWWFGTRNMSKK